MATGFHGAHVIIGTIFLVVCLARVYAGHFTPTQHVGFEAAAWYWHFVDVVWLFLFAADLHLGLGLSRVGAGHDQARRRPATYQDVLDAPADRWRNWCAAPSTCIPDRPRGMRARP